MNPRSTHFFLTLVQQKVTGHQLVVETHDNNNYIQCGWNWWLSRPTT